MAEGNDPALRTTTVGDVIRVLFPQGTREGPGLSWARAPIAPADVFGIAAALVEISGAYHHVFPPRMTLRLPPREARPIILTEDEYHEIASRVKRWDPLVAKAAVGGISQFNSPVQLWWTRVWASRNSPVYVPKGTTAPEWWRPAVLMLIAADQASDMLGYPRNIPSEFEKIYRDIETKHGSLVSHTQLISQDAVCVQPKSRTPRLGVTLRSLSHNLALLPGHGIAFARWHRFNHREVTTDDKALNVVLIPFPYKISSRCFVRDGKIERGDRWGRFHIDQLWLRGPSGVLSESREIIADFVFDIVEKAREEVGEVHGVVFPEFALDWETHRAIYDKLGGPSSVRKDHLRDLEFMIAGSSKNEELLEGNFVILSRWFERGNRWDGREYDEVEIERERFVIRAKHHGWKIDAEQIRRYSLASALDPKVEWVENVCIEERSIDVIVFREGSTLTTMICEDLARIDPCQQLVRAIGPNLVVVLLMDGAQLGARWPARYATILADDPGSSVLTLTSFGLIRRANEERVVGASRNIALWKDDVGGLREIALPTNAQAVCITLSGVTATEYTLDDRADGGQALSWRYDGHYPIQINRSLRGEWDWIYPG